MSSVNFVGSEFPINTITTGSQSTSLLTAEAFSTRAIAVDGSGGFVVVWTGPDGGGSNTGIYARRFDSAGVAQSLFDADSSSLVSTDARINTTTANIQRLASVAADADGNFIVVWESIQDPVTGDSGVYAQRFDKDGNRIGGETQIHTNVLGEQTEVSVAMAPTGEFVVTWTSDVGDGDGTGVFVRRFNSAGVAQPINPPMGPASTNDVQVNTTTDRNQRFSNVAIAPDGSFVVTWSSVLQDGDGYGVYAQRFSSTGARVGPEFPVNTTTASNQQNSHVAIAPDGSFVITWSSENQDGSSWGVYARLFDSNGDPLTGEILVNQFTTGEQRYSTVAMDSDGNFVVTWQSFSQPSETVTTTGIVARRFSRTGTPLGDEFLVNTTTPGDQRFPAVGVAPSGNFVVVWTGPDANGTGVYGQRFSPPTSTAPTDILLTPASFPENSPLDTVIGNLSAIDPDGDIVTNFQLIDSVNFPDNNSFEIQTGSGGPILVLRAAADFETKNSYTIKIRATDPNGLSYDKEVVVAVTNVNEAPTAINLDPQSVDENVPIGTEVGIFTTIDPDFVDTHTYTLVSGTGDTDNASFTIVGNQLRLNVSPDFETKNSYTIRVRTTDSGNLFFEQSFIITINDIDETPPNQTPTAIALTPTNVDENVPVGTTVGTFTTTDPDTGDTHTYTLVSGTGDTDNASFTIVGNQLRLNVSPDFETKNSYTIRVRTTDSGNLFFEQSFIITINDIDETPPNQTPTAIALTPTNVDENVPVGTTVGTFTTTDPDTGDTHTYTLVSGTGDTDNASFTIVGNQLRLNVSPDFETKNSYTIRVRTTDSGNLFFEQSFIITINDIDETPPNQTPTAIALTPTNVDENVPVGTTVGTFTTTDPDTGDTHTYTLVSGTGDTDNASFTIVGNQLRLNVSPDFETKNSYTIRVRTTDSGNLFFEQSFIITINDIDETPPNQTPTAIALTPTNVDENVPVGTTVGTFTTTDPDTGDTHTYTLVAGTGDTDNASFTIVGNQLRLNVSPDFETKNSYTIRVRTTDSGNLFFEQVFTITINDLPEGPPPVNEAPTAIALTPTNVDENVPVGTTVGTFTTTDPDTGDTHTYTLVAGTGDTDNASFTIVGNQLRLNVSPDFETKNSYTIRVRTTDSGNLFFEQSFIITINDIDETPPNQTPTAIALTPTNVDENVPVGTTVGTFTTTDPDTGDTHTYTLVAGTGDTDNASFTIVGNQLRLNVSPDFETKNSYTIRVRTTDSGNLFFEQVFTITINDLPEGPPPVNEAPTAIALTPTNVDENVPVGTTVGTFTTTDPDTGDTHTYTLVAGTGDTDNASFTIVGNQLRLNVSPDFETKNSYTIRVRTTDSGNLFFEQSFIITINDIDETPPNQTPTAIALTPTNVDENVPVGTTVGTFTTTDPDTGDTHTYTLVAGTGDTDNASFTIVGNQLRLNVSPDFETKNSYTIRVRTTDSGNLFFEQVFTITINDLPEGPPPVNEAPTAIALTPTNVDENVPVGTTVGTFTTTDPDTGDTHTYTLVAGTGDTDNASFTIVGNQLRLNVSPDFETKNSYTIRVRTTDSGNLFFEQVFTITINDLPEGPPPPVNEAPTAIALTPTNVDENVPVGTTVGTFTTTDPDTGDTHTYTLVAGTGDTDNASFTIVGNQLRLNVSPDFETKNSYTIRVRTTDSGNLFFEQSFTITINDLPELPPVVNQPPTDIALSSLSVLENVPANTIIGQFDSSDPDHSSGFTYTLVSGAGSTDNAAFLIEGDRLRIRSSPDFETKRSYSIRVRTTDPSGGSFEKVFIISVLDVDETPPNVSASIVVDLNGTAAGIDFSIGAPTVASIKVAAPNATITKTSPTNLTQLVVNLTNPINGASERLIADVSGTNLRTNYDPTGVLTIWGSAPASVYQQVLRTVTYENSAAVPNTSTRTIFAAASDGQTFSPIARTTLNFVGLRQVDGTDGDDVLVTTPNTDLLSGRAGNDIVRSTLANLRQQDVIRGGPGVDTFVLTDGTGTITVNVGNFNSQLPDVSPGTLVTEFEVFDLSGFRGNALMIGADNFDDYLVGGLGNDTLDGGTGNDTLIGGPGNDVYIVRSPADTIIERPNEGNDTVQAAVNYTLPDHVENLVLIDNARTGTGNTQNNRITGNALRNLLRGGAGNDTLVGLAGADTLLGEEGNDLLDGGRGRNILTGGQGRDTFVFGVGRGLGRSIVTDFNLRQDRILVRGTGLSAGRIDAAQFIRGTSARRQSDRFIYDAATGRLFFDPDGTGSQRQVLIGTLSNRPSLGAGNIIVG
ncbi:cadherin domain-containing protein [Thermoleptolyngbya sp. PKUAC-SCTB121]|uniref:cadherin domain-containing protein n=1 Tax=Thermoleptolyngbya sp. PKUAC-SCTB121 TaxID=2811482 RepID=UPI00196569D0|nr:cadherin domain-containing protein [Thermoleptolyngbya sp. PKUAC-SCTB121]